MLYRCKECSYGPTKSWQKLIERSPGLTLCNVPFVTLGSLRNDDRDGYENVT